MERKDKWEAFIKRFHLNVNQHFPIPNKRDGFDLNTRECTSFTIPICQATTTHETARECQNEILTPSVNLASCVKITYWRSR